MNTLIYLAFICALVLCTSAQTTPFRPNLNETFACSARFSERGNRTIHALIDIARNFTSGNEWRIFRDEGGRLVEINLARTDKKMMYQIMDPTNPNAKCTETAFPKLEPVWLWIESATYVQTPDIHGDLWTYMDKNGDEETILVNRFDTNEIFETTFTSRDKSIRIEISDYYCDFRPDFEPGLFDIPKICQ